MEYTLPPIDIVDALKARKIDNVWDRKFCVYKDALTAAPVNLEMCAYGYMFLVILIQGFILVSLAGYCLFMLFVRCPERHLHRKVLFGLIFAVGAVRFSLAAATIQKLSQIHNEYDAVMTMPFFYQTQVPVNVLGDLLTAAVDFLLTFFWLTVLRSRITDGNTGTVAPSVLAAVFTIVGFICFGVDTHNLHKSKNALDVYPMLITYAAVLLLFSAALHSVVVFQLLKRITHINEYVDLSDSVRRHYRRVALIGLVSVTCWVFRGVTLVGRVLSLDIFLHGDLSLSNPTFVFLYNCVFMNIPCMIVAIAFYQLSVDLFVGIEDDQESGVLYRTVDEVLAVQQRRSVLAGISSRSSRSQSTTSEYNSTQMASGCSVPNNSSLVGGVTKAPPQSGGAGPLGAPRVGRSSRHSSVHTPSTPAAPPGTNGDSSSPV